MTTFAEIYSAQNYQDVHAMFAPAQTQLGLKYFGFCRIYPKQKFIHLGSDPEAAHHLYIQQNLPPAFMEQYETAPEGIMLPTIETDAAYGWPEGTVRNIRDQFDVEHPIFILKRFKKHIDVYGLGFKRANIHEFYLTQLEQIEKLVFYFKDKAQDVIQRLESNPATFKGNIAQDAQHILDRTALDLPINHYEIKHKGNVCFISTRQYQVLQNLSLLRSNKEIANQLSLSVKAVEYHINSLKNIFSVFDRQSLISIFRDSHFAR
jgi:DNA-binding CsgD family transcriptional regulator